MNISLFGGAFDPPHLGHQQVVSALLAENIADEVWLLPAKNHPFGKVMSASQHRLQMLQLVLNQLPQPDKVKIERYEIVHDGISYTYQTLQALAAQYPEHDFSFVIGSDNLSDFHKWNGFPQLLEFPFYIYPREGFPFAPLYENMTPLTDMPEVTVSSTQIRSNIQSGDNLDGLVIREVDEYIEKNQLYQ